MEMKIDEIIQKLNDRKPAVVSPTVKIYAMDIQNKDVMIICVTEYSHSSIMLDKNQDMKTQVVSLLKRVANYSGD